MNGNLAQGTQAETRARFGRNAAVALWAVLPRPWLWWPALAAIARLSRRHWWRRPPFLPLPGSAYWHFRMVTAFGGSAGSDALTSADIVAYLQWCRRSRPPRG